MPILFIFIPLGGYGLCRVRRRIPRPKWAGNGRPAYRCRALFREGAGEKNVPKELKNEVRGEKVFLDGFGVGRVVSCSGSALSLAMDGALARHGFDWAQESPYEFGI